MTQISSEQFEEILNNLDIDYQDPAYQQIEEEISNGGVIFIEKFLNKTLNHPLYKETLSEMIYNDLIEEINKHLPEKNEIPTIEEDAKSLGNLEIQIQNPEELQTQIQNEDSYKSQKDNTQILSDQIIEAKNTQENREKEEEEYQEQNKEQYLDHTKLKTLSIERRKKTEKLKNKDTIWFIGSTGSGKSTLINKLLGQKLEIKQVQIEKEYDDVKGEKCFHSSLENQIEIDEGISSIRGPKLGHTTNSETSEVDFYEIHHKDIGNKILVDTPGYGDSNGIEVDIANQILVYESVKNCNTVKIVLVLDYHEIRVHRGQFIKDTLNIVVQFIKNFEEHMENFRFFFNKVPQGVTSENIKTILIQLAEQLKAQKEKTLEKFTRLIITGLNKKYVKILQPIEDNYNNLWEFLDKQKPIENPKEAFMFSISQSNINKINLFARDIVKAIEDRIEDYPYISEQLDFLNFFGSYLSLKLIMDQQNEIKTKVISHVKDQMEKAIQNMKNWFNYNGNLEEKEEDKQFEEIKKVIRLLRSFESHRQTHFPSKKNQSYEEDFVKSIRQFQEKQSKKLKNLQFTNNSEEQFYKYEERFKDKYQSFLKLSKIAHKLSEFEQLYSYQIIQKCKQLLTEQITLVFEEVKEKIQEFFQVKDEGTKSYKQIVNTYHEEKERQSQFDMKILELLLFLHESIDSYSLLEIDKIKDLLRQIQPYITEIICKIENNVNAEVSDLSSSVQTIHIQKYKASYLKARSQLLSLRISVQCFSKIPHLKKEIKVVYDRVLENLQKDYDLVLNQIKNLINLESHQLVKKEKRDIEPKIRSLESMRKLDKILEEKTIECANSVQNGLKQKIKDISDQARNLIENEKEKQIDFGNLQLLLQIMENFKWMDDYYKEKYIQATLDKVYQFIEEYSDTILQYVTNGLEPVQVEKIDFKDINLMYKRVQQFQIKFQDKQKINDNYQMIETKIQEKVQNIAKKFEFDIEHQTDQNKICNFNWKILKRIYFTLLLLLDLPEKFSSVIDEKLSKIRMKLTNQIIKDHIYLREICTGKNFLEQAGDQKTLDSLNNIKLSEEYPEIINENDEDYQNTLKRIEIQFKRLLQEYKKMNTKNQKDFVQINNFYPKMEQIALNLSDHFPNFYTFIQDIEDSQETISKEFKSLKNIALQGDFISIEPEVIMNLKNLKGQDNEQEYKKICKIIKEQFKIKSRELKNKLQGNNDNLNKLEDKLKEFETGIHKIYQAKQLFEQNCLNDIDFYDQEQKQIQDLLSRVFLTQFKLRFQNCFDNYKFKQLEEDLIKCRNLFESIEHIFQEEKREKISNILTNFEKKQDLKYELGEFKQIQKILVECQKAEEMSSLKYQNITKDIQKKVKGYISQKLKDIEKEEDQVTQTKLISQLESKTKHMNEFYTEELYEIFENIRTDQKQKEEKALYILNKIISQVEESSYISNQEIRQNYKQIETIQKNYKSLMNQFQQMIHTNIVKLQNIIKSLSQKLDYDMSLQQSLQQYQSWIYYQELLKLDTNQIISQFKYQALVFKAIRLSIADYNKQFQRDFIENKDKKVKRQRIKSIQNSDQNPNSQRFSDDDNLMSQSFPDTHHVNDFKVIFSNFISWILVLRFCQENDQDTLKQQIIKALEILYTELVEISDEQKNSLDTQIELMPLVLGKLEKLDSFNQYINDEEDFNLKSIKQNLAEHPPLDEIMDKIQKVMKGILKSHIYQYNTEDILDQLQNNIAINLNDNDYVSLTKNIIRIVKQVQISKNDTLLTECKDQIRQSHEQLQTECQNLLEQEKYKEFEKNFQIFCTRAEEIDKVQEISMNLSQDISKMQQQMKQILKGGISELKKHCSKSNPNNPNMLHYNYIAQILANIHDISFSAPSFRQFSRQAVEEGLHIFVTNKLNLRILQSSFNSLENDDLVQRGKDIVNSFNIFKQIQLEQFQRQISQLSIEDIIEQFSLMDNFNKKEIDKKTLIENFKIVQAAYEQTINEYIDIFKIETISILPEKIKEMTSDLNFEKMELNNGQKIKICKLIGVLFACWTLLDIDIEVIKTEKDFFYRKPNNNQIFALLLLLGCDQCDNFLKEKTKAIFNKKNKLVNQIIQILTGEGKSIIIGITALLFSILGYSVHVACYSKYLCKRDYKSFEKIFNFFKVEDYISYGTFGDLSEDILNENIDIREASQNLVYGNKQNGYQNIQNQKESTILILDEIDTFFNDSFYGITYNPCFSLKIPEIEDIQREIWEKGKPRDQGRSLESADQIFSSIQKIPSFEAVMKAFPSLRQILNQQIKKMCDHVCLISYHNYILQNEKIGYKTEDHSISFSTYKGYLTLFAYFKENEEGNVSDETLKKKLGLDIHSGYLSYAEIPKKYKNIFGVTGTLESLHSDLKALLQNYNICKQIYVPSMFNKSNLVFRTESPDYFSVEPNESNWMKKIKDIAVQKTKNQQAVLIFFDSNQVLKQFYNSEYFADFKINCIQITEESMNKDNLIKDSTRNGMISLITKDFGRGTDFICFDDKVQENGGVVVIQTFLSLDFSEQVQIKGRTGRQSQKGSYHLILNQKTIVDEFDVSKEQLDKWAQKDNFYQEIHNKRNEMYGEKIQKYKENIQEASERHRQTEQYLEYLKQDKKEQAMDLLQKINLGDAYNREFQFSPSSHIIFNFNKSLSAKYTDEQQINRWEQLVIGFEKFIQQKLQKGQTNHIVSVIYNDEQVRIIANEKPIQEVLTIVKSNSMVGGNNQLFKGIDTITQILDNENHNYKNYQKQVFFLSDGVEEEQQADLNRSLLSLNIKHHSKISVFWILGYGPEVNIEILQKVTDTIPDCGGKLKLALDGQQLSQQFADFQEEI